MINEYTYDILFHYNSTQFQILQLPLWISRLYTQQLRYNNITDVTACALGIHTAYYSAVGLKQGRTTRFRPITTLHHILKLVLVGFVRVLICNSVTMAYGILLTSDFFFYPLHRSCSSHNSIIFSQYIRIASTHFLITYGQGTCSTVLRTTVLSKEPTVAEKALSKFQP